MTHNEQRWEGTAIWREMALQGILLFGNTASEWLDIPRVCKQLSGRHEVPEPIMAAVLDELERDGLLEGIRISDVKQYRYRPPDQWLIRKGTIGEGLE